MSGDSTHIVCERLSAMQELARLREFFAQFAQNTILCPGKFPPSRIGTSHGGPRKFGFEASRIPHPRIGIPSSPSLDWNFSWRTWKVYVCPPWIPSSLHSCSIGSRVRESRLNIESKILINKKK